MKSFIMFITTLILLNFQTIKGQTEIDQILDFQRNIDINSMIDEFYKICSEAKEIRERDLRYYSNPLCDFDFSKWHQSPVIYFLLSDDAINFKGGEDIYKYLEVDSIFYFIVYNNESGSIKGNLFDWDGSISFDKKGYPGLRKNFRKVYLKEPDAFLLSRCFLYKHKKFLLFVKGSNIFITRKILIFRRTMELNDYINKYYLESEIQRIGKKNDFFKFDNVILIHPSKKFMRKPLKRE